MRLSQRLMLNLTSKTFNSHRQRLILGIESSCDDSCAAVIAAPDSYAESMQSMTDRPKATILSQRVEKQDHFQTRGIAPLAAANGHAANVPLAISAALKEANVSRDGRELDGIAVTLGPGMPQSLGQGLIAAKTLSQVWDLPLIYVHHMAAHALTPVLTEEADSRPTFPFLTFLLSGGHTMLVLAEGISKFKILANCQDNSIGTAFDKTARALNLEWSSQVSPGKALEDFAAQRLEGAASISDQEKEMQRIACTPFRRILKGRAAFSYSGLISEVLRRQEELNSISSTLSVPTRMLFSRSFQEAAWSQLKEKLDMSLSTSQTKTSSSPSTRTGKKEKLPPGEMEKDQLAELCQDVKHVVISGGVASNSSLRDSLFSCLRSMGREDVKLVFPPAPLCTDNAVMIAHMGHLLWDQRTMDTEPLAIAKWSLEELKEGGGRKM